MRVCLRVFTCASECVESEFKLCKVHLSLPSDYFFPLMCMFVCVQKD